MFINKTIARVGYAMITSESNAGVEYDENITWFESGEAGGREFKATAVGNTFTLDADGIIVLGGEVNNGYDIELTLLALIDEIKEKWLGRQKTADGHVETGGVVSYPKFALADFWVIKSTTSTFIPAVRCQSAPRKRPSRIMRHSTPNSRHTKSLPVRE